jgi:hypothetical protein
MKTIVKGFITGKFVLLGLAALMATVFVLDSCEVPTDTVKDLGNIYENTVKKPTASLEEGLVAKNDPVMLLTVTAGATIYYTEDGSVPTKNSILRGDAGTSTVSVTIDEDKIIKAIAVKEGWNDSEVLTVEYEVSDEVPSAPVFDLTAGIYDSNQTVTITTTTAGATIHYTTDDDTDPTDSSSSGIEGTSSATVSINKSTTLKAIAVKSGTKTGKVQAVYTLKPATPTADPAAGPFFFEVRK